MPLGDEFDELAVRATGVPPYPYQRRLALEGLPEVLAVPTGAGKTMAAVLPWLFRRRFHPDPVVRAATPRRLVFVMPMRTLVEQAADAIAGWLRSLGLSDPDAAGGGVATSVLMGGEPREVAWRLHPERDAVIIGTLDMIVSRALNRGFGESRFMWPVDFGLLNNDCHYVYDEIQLMGPALATSRQLHGLRERLGVAASCTSTWMSATIDERRLRTFDAPRFAEPVGLSGDDRSHPALARRLDAAKLVSQIVLPAAASYEVALADEILASHRSGTLTLAVLNTVDRATAVVEQLTKRRPDAEVVLVHSRFRPGDRSTVVQRVRADVDPEGPGRIVVSTQVVEAGLDISATVLISELAPWPSIVQRAGRCNRDGRAVDARLRWVEPPKPPPYLAVDLESSREALQSLERVSVTAATLSAVEVTVTEVIEPVLRHRDLIDLFDTAPDIAGNDIDISRWVRATDELDIAVAWRLLPSDRATRRSVPMPTREERCPVPIGQLREWIAKRGAGREDVLLWDHVAGEWQPCRREALRPGMVVVIDGSLGGYVPSRGWSPTSRMPVDPVAVALLDRDDVAIGDDPVSEMRAWVSLTKHLRDAEHEAIRLDAALAPAGLDARHRDAAIAAARLHDVGKAHPVFQQSLLQTVRDGDAAPGTGVFAKSGGSGRLRHGVKNFRHELCSALMLLGDGRQALADVAEPDLAVYLVAAHHGRVRLGARSLPNDEHGRILGVADGEVIGEVELDGGSLPSCRMDLDWLGLGDVDGQAPWSRRALTLRDRADLGPFRLAYLEAIVRVADWWASQPAPAEANPEGGQ